MHPKRLELLRKAYPKEHCLSAISMHRFNDYDIPLATPLVVTSEPFMAAIPVSTADMAGISVGYKEGGHYYFKNKEKTTLAEIADIAPKNIDDVLVTSVSKVKALNFFPSRGDGWDHTYFNINPKSISIIPVKPLIWDEGYICEVDSILGVVGDKILIDQVQELFKSYRYVTYCINNLKKNKIGGGLAKEISQIIHNLAKRYTAYKCYSYLDYYEAYLLMDCFAITFYRLQDVIAIYDYKRIDGVAVDVYACSSQIRSINDMPGAVMLYRFIFNSSKENLFTIDGEKITRWVERSLTINDSLSAINGFLNKNTPATKQNNNSGGL